MPSFRSLGSRGRVGSLISLIHQPTTVVRQCRTLTGFASKPSLRFRLSRPENRCTLPTFLGKPHRLPCSDRTLMVIGLPGAGAGALANSPSGLRRPVCDDCCQNSLDYVMQLQASNASALCVMLMSEVPAWIRSSWSIIELLAAQYYKAETRYQRTFIKAYTAPDSFSGNAQAS
ncbi:hypothetical protein CHU98_g12404 [Xylaria longipes]|nr:hypothetical protein CHU98_g12404 [Xylaria longipes]